MKITLAKTAAVTAIAASAALAGASAAHAAPVSPVPVPETSASAQKPVTGTQSLSGAAKSAALSSTTCDSVGHSSYAWWGNCRVLSGYARSWAYCSNNTYRYGAWVGVGYWKFGTSCYPYLLRNYGIQISD